MMAFLKIAGWIIAIALLALAAFLAQTPWRVHGGRFVTEYMLLAGAVGFVGAVIVVILLIWGWNG